MSEDRIRLVVHGGAGTIARERMTPTLRAAYEADLRDALVRGHTVLANGGTSLDACIAAVLALEDSPLFNAGKGAVFTADGRNELDAAVMEGAGLRAGAVAGVTTIRNPVLAARAVMEASPHVLLIGPAAEDFAARQGLAMVGPDYFFTQERYDQLKRAKAEGAIQLDHDGTPNAVIDLGKRVGEGRYGTVGAVAIDRNGTVAAATSTGGMTNKQPGRVGDTPVIGAGTYAANDGAAVSATGTGEAFMRIAAGHEVTALMRYRRLTLRDAAADTIAQLGRVGGEGGLIGVDREGNYVLTFNTPGMYRGTIGADGIPETAIFHEDGLAT